MATLVRHHSRICGTVGQALRRRALCGEAQKVEAAVNPVLDSVSGTSTGDKYDLRAAGASDTQ